MRRRPAIAIALTLGVAALIAGAGPAAVMQLPPCGTVTKPSATLTGDCAAPLVIAKTGTRVNLGGHTVTCTEAWEADYEEWDHLADPRVGIQITNRRAVHVSNGSVIGCGKGIHIAGGRSHRITGLRVLYHGSDSGAGTWGTGAGMLIERSSHNFLGANTISENGGPAVVLEGGTLNRIVGNTIRENIGGLLLDGVKTYVDSNVIANTRGEDDAGIDAGASSIVRWNRVDRTYWAESGIGIRAYENSILRGNLVTRSGGSGIWAASGVTVIGNTVTGNGTAGWTGCGIEVAGTGALVTENSVMNNGTTGDAVGGICATGAGNRIRLNVIGGSGDVDLRDDSGICTANLWLGNTFATSFPGCLG